MESDGWGLSSRKAEGCLASAVDGDGLTGAGVRRSNVRTLHDIAVTTRGQSRLISRCRLVGIGGDGKKRLVSA